MAARSDLRGRWKRIARREPGLKRRSRTRSSYTSASGSNNQRHSMKTNHELPPMNANEESKLLLKEEVFQIVGAAMEVLNGVGHGFHEKPYENALVVEFGLRKIPYRQQANFPM